MQEALRGPVGEEEPEGGYVNLVMQLKGKVVMRRELDWEESALTMSYGGERFKRVMLETKERLCDAFHFVVDGVWRWDVGLDEILRWAETVQTVKEGGKVQFEELRCEEWDCYGYLFNDMRYTPVEREWDGVVRGFGELVKALMPHTWKVMVGRKYFDADYMEMGRGGVAGSADGFISLVRTLNRHTVILTQLTKTGGHPMWMKWRSAGVYEFDRHEVLRCLVTVFPDAVKDIYATVNNVPNVRTLHDLHKWH
ncbi:hypothetical protein HK097_005370 [Rhizophlyctis rosea]|uniref:Uncharacterized protein n=1 Tax=Rhizophlyctis rosea TaxID=64517 RepID=A0AAD5X5J9_9FUNG|nr:hypothetical protein HK097_005370 [Rhizophlyctis rosea]